MPVSAVVANLTEDAVERRQVLDKLESDPRVEVGPRQGLYQPLVLTTETLGEGIGMVKEELPALEGISFVRIVRVDFDDADAAEESEGGWSQLRDREPAGRTKQ